MLQNDRVNKRKPTPIQIRVKVIFTGLLGALCVLQKKCSLKISQYSLGRRR